MHAYMVRTRPSEDEAAEVAQWAKCLSRKHEDFSLILSVLVIVRCGGACLQSWSSGSRDRKKPGPSWQTVQSTLWTRAPLRDFVSKNSVERNYRRNSVLTSGFYPHA